MSTTIDKAQADHKTSLQAPWLVMAKKELRENAVWAAMGLLALALGLCYQIASADGAYPNAYTLRDVWKRIDQAMVLAGPLMATLLGLLQILPEQRRDLWAFLMHRPANRSSLFWGKVTAGLMLYALATLVPFFAVVFWAKTPGNLPGPFVWGLVLGGLGAILAGVPFYFAGLLTGLRPARWYGSRAVPIAGAVVVAIFLNSPWFTSFGIPAALTAIGTLPFVLAARAAYVTSGRFDRRVFGGKLSLGIVLLAGLTIVFSAFVGLCYSVLMPIYAARVIGEYSRYQLLPDGELVKTTSRDGSVDPVLTPVRDERGRLATKIHARDKSSSTLPMLVAGGMDHADQAQPPYNDAAAYADAQPDTSRPYDIAWYYVPNNGQFIRYDIQRRTATGVLGPNGLSNPKDVGRAGRFTGRLKFKTQLQPGEIYFVDRGSLYRVSLSEATARRVALPFPVASIQSVVSLSGDSQFGVNLEPSASGADPGVMVSNGAQFAVVSKAGDTLYTVAREYSATEYPTVEAQCAVQSGSVYLWYESGSGKQISIWDTHGRHVASYGLPDIAVAANDEVRPLQMLAMPPAVPAMMYIWACGQARHSESWRASVKSLREHSAVIGYACTAVSGALCAVASLFITRRRGLLARAQAAWALGMFWLGVPGILMMLSMEGFPGRVACPSCGRKRIVTHETCEHCAAPFPAPATDGTEIFGDGAAYAETPASVPAST